MNSIPTKPRSTCMKNPLTVLVTFRRFALFSNILKWSTSTALSVERNANFPGIIPRRVIVPFFLICLSALTPYLLPLTPHASPLTASLPLTLQWTEPFRQSRMFSVFPPWTAQCGLSTFFRALSAGFPQRSIHRLVDREEIPTSWVRVNFLLEHGTDLMRGYAGHTGIDPSKVGPVLSIGEGKVDPINDPDGIGLLLPFA